MIKTPTQLKALVKNQVRSDSSKAQLWFRNYAMERLLDRLSQSRYRDNFILKGGMLVASIVGLSNRATMDIDTTIRNLPLDQVTVHWVLRDICDIDLGDNMRFEIKDVSEIMEEADYPGIRASMNAYLDTMRIPLKVDISAGDVITPAEVAYRYKMMFEDRYIILRAYNLETVLAEKMETILTRGALSTRMRDFYDLYILQNSELEIDSETLYHALVATSKKRGSGNVLSVVESVREEVCSSQVMRNLWDNFRRKYDYAKKLDWETVSSAAFSLCQMCVELDQDIRIHNGIESPIEEGTIMHSIGLV